jgi:hypothetical protein
VRRESGRRPRWPARSRLITCVRSTRSYVRRPPRRIPGGGGATEALDLTGHGRGREAERQQGQGPRPFSDPSGARFVKVDSGDSRLTELDEVGSWSRISPLMKHWSTHESAFTKRSRMAFRSPRSRGNSASERRLQSACVLWAMASPSAWSCDYLRQVLTATIVLVGSEDREDTRHELTI